MRTLRDLTESEWDTLWLSAAEAFATTKKGDKYFNDGLCYFIRWEHGIPEVAFPLGEYASLDKWDFWENFDPEGHNVRVLHACWLATIGKEEFFRVIDSPNN